MDADFLALHATPPGECFCMFWYLPDGKDWSKVTAAENRAGREAALKGGVYDGYLAYVDGTVAAWCQAAPRDSLGYLRRRFVLGPAPSTWAISCFYVLPGERRKKLATKLLRFVLADLTKRGVKHVEAYPRRGSDLTPDDLWNGPEAMWRREGFSLVRDDERRPILARDL